MKKILIIDDSALMRRVLSDIINRTNEYRAEYIASNGIEGLKILSEHDDIMAIFCDLNMPKMNGLEFLSALKHRGIKIPVFMISSNEDVANTIAALSAGALEFIKKPERIMAESAKFESVIMKTLAIANEYRDFDESQTQTHNVIKKDTSTNPVIKKGSKRKKLVALVCSTGGPRALQYVIPKLPANLDAPVVIVQHMPAGFTKSLSERLDSMSQISVKEAEDNEILQKGKVYIAKGGTHLTVQTKNQVSRIVFDDSPAVVGLKPCGNIMYNSLQSVDFDQIICVVLTGMGADGTKGITELSAHKEIYVISQNEDTCTVYGMPKAIYESGIVDCVCGINNVAEEIIMKVGVQ